MANMKIERGINEKGQFYFSVSYDGKRDYMADIVKDLSKVDRVKNYQNDTEFCVTWGEQKTTINYDLPLSRENSPLPEFKERILDVIEKIQAWKKSLPYEESIEFEI